MDEVIKPKRSLYCPITVSGIATNNAKVRQNSLREYSHTQDAAYRAFCRGPGRPQTAAFGRVYFETRRLNRQSLSPSKTNLRDCVTASKAMVEERTVKSSCGISHSANTERRLLSRGKSARRTLRYPAEELNEEEAVRINGSEQSLHDTIGLSIENNEETKTDFMSEEDSGSEEKRYDSESIEINKSTPSEDCVSDRVDKQLVVYHFVGTGCSCAAADSYHGDPLVGCNSCSCDEQLSVSSYSVEMQGEGHQSTPGLGNCDSRENKALWDLFQKQLSLVCY